MKKILLVGSVLVLAFGFFVANTARAANTWEVNNTTYSDDTNCVVASGECNTIQAAVDAASSGDTINISAGTYDEQVVINGKSLTIQGAGDATVIQPSVPSKLASVYTYPAGFMYYSGVTIAGIVNVENATNSGVTIKNLEVDGSNVTSLPAGASRLAGILYGESAGLINSVTVNSIKTAGYAKVTYGIDLSAAVNTVTVEVSSSTITDFARNGIMANGPKLTANIHNNIITGPATAIGPDQVPNGIVFMAELFGTISTNTISSLHYVNADSSWRSVGMMGFDTVRPGVVVNGNEIFNVDDGINPSNGFIFEDNNIHNNGSGVVLEMDEADNHFTNNTITNNEHGIQINGALNSNPEGQDPPGAGNFAHDNTITGNAMGVVSYDNTQTFDAINNWWGNAGSSTIASLITANVTYNPWYADSNMTALKYITTSDSTTASTTVSSDTMLTGTSTASGSVTVTANIPSGTTVTGDTSWDGVISAPTATTVTVTIPGFDTPVTSAIAIGSSESDLTFNNAVKLTFAGQAGTLVGWYDHAGTFTQITDTCDNNVATTTINGGTTFPAGGSCVFSNDGSGNLVVWTEHFSTFVTYTQTATPAPAPTPTPTVGVSSGGGGLVGGGGGGGGGYYAPTTTPAPAPAPVLPTGQVLGAIAYRFTATLKLGMSGNDVTELQKLLTSEGVYSGPITGYFGPLTQAAVKAYQLKHGLPGTGFVGQLTRAQLNSSQVLGASTTSASAEALQAQIAVLQNKLVALLQQLVQTLQSQVSK